MINSPFTILNSQFEKSSTASTNSSSLLMRMPTPSIKRSSSGRDDMCVSIYENGTSSPNAKMPMYRPHSFSRYGGGVSSSSLEKILIPTG